VVVGDAARAEQRAKLLRPEEVTAHGVLQVGLPVESDRARHVRLPVERGVLVDLHDPDAVVVEVLLEPPRLDEDLLCILGQRAALLWVLGIPIDFQVIVIEDSATLH